MTSSLLRALSIFSNLLLPVAAYLAKISRNNPFYLVGPFFHYCDGDDVLFSYHRFQLIFMRYIKKRSYPS